MPPRASSLVSCFVLAVACGGSPGGARDAGPVTDDPALERPPPGACGLADPAFCEDFEAGPSVRRGRAGELDRARFSGARVSPLGPTARDRAFPIGGAMIGACRGGLPEIVLPDQDMLVCEPTDDVHSRHALVAVAAQNYGQSSLRIRQPFDFSDRTGTIVFDTQAYSTLGWVSLEITEDPISVPSYAIFVNDEGGVLPRNGVEVHFNTTCGVSGVPTTTSVSAVHVFEDFEDTVYLPEPRCEPAITVRKHALNRIEVRVSASRIEVYGSPVSDDGVVFGERTLLYAQDIELPFTRGYVHLSTHNHATLKYSTADWAGNGGETELDAWVTRFDNIAFDGPLLAPAREHEIANANRSTPFDSAGDPIDPNNESGGVSPALSVGYIVPDEAETPLALTFENVSLEGATRARLSLVAWYLVQDGTGLEDFALRYRVNGGTVHEQRLTAAQRTSLVKPRVRFFPDSSLSENTGTNGATAQILDVPVGELVSGTNVIELVSVRVPRNYPPAVVNVDLLVD